MLRKILLLSVATLLCAGCLPGATLVVNDLHIGGTVVEMLPDDQFARPDEYGTYPDDPNFVNFVAFEFAFAYYNAYNFTVTPVVSDTYPGLWDTYLYIYEGPQPLSTPSDFDPPVNSFFLAGNDDAVPGDVFAGSRLAPVFLSPNTRYFVVVAGFSSADVGDFNLDIDVDTPLPEPGTFAVLGAGLMGLALLHRRFAR